MNCNTGEITNDPEVIRKWRELGIPVVELPGYAPEETYTTAPVQSGGRPFRRDPVTGLKLRVESELLNALGAKVVDSEADTLETQERKAREFAARVHARQR